MTASAAPTMPRIHLPKPARWIGGIVGAIILLIVLFLMFFNWDMLRGPISRLASAKIHRSVRIDGHLRVHLLTWTPTVRVEGLKIGEPDWAPKGDMAQVDSITVSVKLMPLFLFHIDVPLVDIEKPNLVLIQDAKNRANWDFDNTEQKKKASKPFKLPPIQKFVIADGKLSADIAPRKLRFTGTVNSTERATKSNAETFKLVGTGTLNAKPFQMNVAGGPLINVHRNQPYPFDADVRAVDTHVVVHGHVPHPFDLGRLDTTVLIEGRDLNDLYYLTGLALPNTPPYRVSGHLVRDEKVYDFSNAAGRVGDSDLEGHLKVDTTNKRPYLKAQLASRLLDFKDLASLFGAPGASKAATPEQKAAARSVTAGGGRILPDATLQTDRMRAMDADVTYKAASVKATPHLPLRGLDLGVKLDDGLLTLDPVRFDFPQGSLAGAVKLNARGADPVTDLDLRLSNVRMEQFIPAGSGPKPLEGTLAARAKLHGVGDSVHKAAASADGQVTAVIPAGQIRQAFAELLGIDATKGLFQLLSKDQQQTDVRCAIADFRVHNGVMQAQRILIDTTVVVVDGQGSINLGDESINLVFKGKPTKFRLVHLDAPITVGGHLKSPTFGVRPGTAIVQAGAAVALGAVLSPLAVLLPFIDPGLAKNANCGAVLAAAHSGPAAVSTRAAAPPPHHPTRR